MKPNPADFPTLRELARGRSGNALATNSIWWEAAPPGDGPDIPLPRKADVVIIGSGFTGLAAALTLVREGRHLVVVDAGVPGFGASTRNGGQVGSGNQKFRIKTLIAMKGERNAVELLREGIEMLDGIEALIQREQIDCDFERSGRFRGAMRPEHYETMARDMEDLRRCANVESEMIPRAEQRKEIGTDLFYGGSLLPHDASLHPGRYHAGLLARVREAGGLVCGHAAVKDIVSERNRHLVRFDGFDIEARDVIVATNGYTKNVGSFFAKRIVPVVSSQIATGDIPPDLFDAALPKRRVFGNSNRVFFYFRPAPREYRLIWGGRSKSYRQPRFSGGLRASRTRSAPHFSRTRRGKGPPRVGRYDRIYVRRISASRTHGRWHPLRYGLLRHGGLAIHPLRPQDRAPAPREARRQKRL